MISLFVSLSKSRGRWKVLLVGWIATAALGMWGMRLAPDGRTFLDDLYQLSDLFGLGFSLELGTPTGSSRWRAGSGRCVAAASLLEGIAAVSRRRSDAWRGRRRRAPFGVLGLGDRGTRIATALADAGRDVVAVEVDPSTPVSRCCGGVGARSSRATPGFATSWSRRARRGRRGGRRVRRRRDERRGRGDHLGALPRAPGAGPLRAAVHLSDAGLCALMRHQSLRTAASGVRFDFFDVYSAGARLLLSYHPLADRGRHAAAHLVIVGVGQFGRCVVEAAARESRDGETTITVIDRDAEARLQAILLAQPGLAQQARIDAVDIDLERPGRDAADRLHATLGRGVTTVAVCFDDDARAVTTALLIRRLLGTAPTVVIARTSGSGGLSLLLGEGATAAGVIPFPLLERACTREIVEGGANEQVARAIHADYTDRASDTPYDIPWDELPRRGAGVEPAPGRLAGGGARRDRLRPRAARRLGRPPRRADAGRGRRPRPPRARPLAGRAHGGRLAGTRRSATPRSGSTRCWCRGRSCPTRRRPTAARRRGAIPSVLALAGLEVLRLDAVPVSSAACSGWMMPRRTSNGSRRNAIRPMPAASKAGDLHSTAQLDRLFERGVGVGDRHVDPPVGALGARPRLVELDQAGGRARRPAAGASSCRACRGTARRRGRTPRR